MENEKTETEKLDMSKKPTQEVAIFGFGVLINQMGKLLEKVEKIDKKLFFMEKRQQEWYEKEHPEAKKSY
jgi:hypothetical protein